MQVAIQITKILKEDKLYLIQAIIKYFRRPYVIHCLRETIEIQ